jgi:hypothetical protein
MSDIKIRVSELDICVTTTGYVALTSDILSPSIAADLFGSSGPLPPKKLSTLINAMLESTKRFPDATDAGDLQVFQAQLNSCLNAVSQRLIELE